ncbi:MAG: VCBS repeat-containing protein [Balneolales bacterium]|nr:VCBS repeat-containing protein [Balneolales bacterium]
MIHSYLKPSVSINAGLFILFWALISSCNTQTDETEPLFEFLSPERTGVLFENQLEFLQEFNIYTYRNFYDGGGVAVGDVSGNGLPDIYFIHNMRENRLFLNQGDYRFVDATETAGVAGTRRWSTGAAMVDINGNGLLDIYVTNSGTLDDARNELFINNGDGTFTERAEEFGLDDPGYSIMAYFFDYNGDGLLDMYLINNEDEAISSFDLSNLQREERDFLGGDRLFRNDGGSFTDVTEEAGLYSSIIGFALSASISDLNRNGLPDIFVANDFFERDYIYMNNGDGTFTEVAGDERIVRSMSAASMGSDAADLTNNGWPDIYVSDMLPFYDDRIKQVTIFEDWGRYNDKANWGYGHQFTRNVLHLNENGTHFKEVSRLTQTEATDWSWAVLLADFDLNGYNDILVTNGLVQDITNLDYLGEISDQETMRSVIMREGVDFRRLIDMIPAQPVRNVLFANRGDLRFEDVTINWGLDEPTFSSGAAWADLNGNGALDLIINNVNSPSRIYRNRVGELYPDRTSLQIKLEGESPNTLGIGAQLQVWTSDEGYYFREHFLQRGFQSSVEPGFHVGLGTSTLIDSLIVRWPDGRTSRMDNIEAPARITLQQQDARHMPAPSARPSRITGDAQPENKAISFEDITESSGPDKKHERFEFLDFSREKLLFRMRSTEGPAACAGDVNGNGLDDVYLGGARNQSGSLFIQSANGSFSATQQTVFEQNAPSEDIHCVFFDATGNGFPDLYVVSGGNSYASASSALNDRFYLNDGNGSFRYLPQQLPSARNFVSGSVVLNHDFTGNGHQDLFVGTRLRAFAVGTPVDSFLLEGDGSGIFRDVTESYIPDLRRLGMVTDAVLADVTGSGEKELIVTGEWMGIHIFTQNGETWREISGDSGLDAHTGWWNAIAAADLNGNGHVDIIAGNHGLNSLFRASSDVPVRMWVGDFENNGMLTHILAINRDGKEYPKALRHDLLEEVPSLRSRYPDFKSYAGQTMQEIFSVEQLNNARLLEATTLGSTVFWNNGDGTFRPQLLPMRAQLAPVYGILAEDLNGNGYPEVLLAGNLYGVKPQSGPYDASRGVMLQYNPERKALEAVSSLQSGFEVLGEGRNILSIKGPDMEKRILVARYNDRPLLYRFSAE